MDHISVDCGGAVGAMGRYAISFIPVRAGLPVLTLLTNIIGAVLNGFIAGIIGANMNISFSVSCFGRQGCAVGLRHFPHFH